CSSNRLRMSFSLVVEVDDHDAVCARSGLTVRGVVRAPASRATRPIASSGYAVSRVGVGCSAPDAEMGVASPVMPDSDACDDLAHITPPAVDIDVTARGSPTVHAVDIGTGRRGRTDKTSESSTAKQVIADRGLAEPGVS